MLEEERLLTFVLQLLLNGLLAFLIKERAVQPSKYSVVHASSAKNKLSEEKLEDKRGHSSFFWAQIKCWICEVNSSIFTTKSDCSQTHTETCGDAR